MDQLPDEIIWSICLYAHDTMSMSHGSTTEQFAATPTSHLALVCRQWHHVLGRNMFWQEKLMHSQYLMQPVPQDHTIVTEASMNRDIDKLKRELSDERNYGRRNGRPTKKPRLYYVMNQTLTNTTFIEYMNKCNRLCKTLFNDWISYWTSNFDFSDSDDDVLSTTSSSSGGGDGGQFNSQKPYVFQTPIQLLKCGVAYLGARAMRLQSRHSIHRVQVHISLTSKCSNNDDAEDDNGRRKKKNKEETKKEQQEMWKIERVEHRGSSSNNYDDGDEEFDVDVDDEELSVILDRETFSFASLYHLIMQMTRLVPSFPMDCHSHHHYEWSDPHLNNSTAYPIIPFISLLPETFKVNHELNFDLFVTQIGAHEELYSSEEVYRWKSIQFSTNDDEVTVELNEEQLQHNAEELYATKTEIDLDRILPAGPKYRAYRDFVKYRLKEPKFCLLGMSQMNPVTVYIVGKMNGALCGFLTATFHSPN